MDERLAKQIQGARGRQQSDPRTVPGTVAVPNNPGTGRASKANIDRSDRIEISPAGGPCISCNRECKGRVTFLTCAIGHGARDLLADRGMFCDQVSSNPEYLHFLSFRIGYVSCEEEIGTSGLLCKA